MSGPQGGIFCDSHCIPYQQNVIRPNGVYITIR